METLYRPVFLVSPLPTSKHNPARLTRTPQTLHGPESNQLAHPLGEAARQGEDDKHDIGGHEGDAAADNVGDAGKEHGAAEKGQRIGQGDPVDVVDVLKLDGDGEKGRRDDGRVEHGEEEAEGDAGGFWLVRVG